MSRVISGALLWALISASFLHAQTIQIQAPDGVISVAGPDGTVLSTFTPVPQGAVPAVSGQAPRDNAQPPKTGTSRIRGRAMAADSGQPLRRATVRLMSPELGQPRSTVTDGEGRYEFRDLPASRYTLSASKNGYVMTSYGARAANQPGRVINLADRQEADRVDFTLPRGGVITGRVIDEYGDPVVGASVQPLRSQIINGQRNESPMGMMSTTTDTGEFRIWGLMPGDYHVMVSTPRMMGMQEITDDRTGYAPTYYPGTPNGAEAQNIPIVAGQTVTGIDIALIPTRTGTISGSAVDASGQPVRRGNVMLMPKTTGVSFMMGMSGGGQIRPDGTFTISNVAPGEYTVRGTIPPSGPGMPAEQLTASVSVAGADVTGVILTPVRPIRVAGRIMLDPPGTWATAAGVRVMAQPKSPTPMMFTGGFTPPIVKDDFTFELTSGSGAVLLRAFPNGPGASPWMLKSVRYDGKEIIDSGLELSDGRDVDGVEIVLTNRQQTVTGVVTNSRGEPVLDAAVTFFPQSPDEWLGATRRLGGARPDQNGRYSSRSLPPGDYFAVALESSDGTRRNSDPQQFYDGLSRVATPFTLVEGETRVVDLKVVVQP